MSIIDILVGILDLDEVSSFVIPLGKIDYEYVPKPELKDRMFFRKVLWGQGTCHLHICKHKSNELSQIIS